MSSNFFLVLHSAIKIFLPLHPSLKLFLVFSHHTSPPFYFTQSNAFSYFAHHSSSTFYFSTHSCSSFYFLSSFTLFLLLSLLIHALHFNSFVIQSLPFTSPFPLASLLVTQALISTYLSLKPFHLHLSSSKLFLPPISSLKPLLVILWSFKLFLPLL